MYTYTYTYIQIHIYTYTVLVPGHAYILGNFAVNQSPSSAREQEDDISSVALLGAAAFRAVDEWFW